MHLSARAPYHLNFLLCFFMVLLVIVPNCIISNTCPFVNPDTGIFAFFDTNPLPDYRSKKSVAQAVEKVECLGFDWFLS